MGRDVTVIWYRQSMDDLTDADLDRDRVEAQRLASIESPAKRAARRARFAYEMTTSEFGRARGRRQ